MIEIPPELIIEGVSRAWLAWLERQPAIGEQLVNKCAEMLCELLTAGETANALGITRATLRANWRKYGLDKSLMLGPNEPRYFRSQVMALARSPEFLFKGRDVARVEKAREKISTRIMPFPRRQAPTIGSDERRAS